MKKRIFSLITAVVCLAVVVFNSSVAFADDLQYTMSFSGTYSRERQWEPYAFTETDIPGLVATATVEGKYKDESNNDKRTFAQFTSDNANQDMKHVTFYGYPSSDAVYDSTDRKYYRDLYLLIYYYDEDVNDVYYNFSTNTNSIYYNAATTPYLGYQQVVLQMNQTTLDFVKIKSAYFYDAQGDNTFSFRNAYRYDIIGMSDDLSVWSDSDFTDLVARGVNYGYDTHSPFTVNYPDNFGLNMSRDITITGKQGFSWEDKNNQLAISISLSDQFLTNSGKYNEINDMTYGVVVTIGTEPISEASDISAFLCNSSKTIFTAYNTEGYYYEGSSSTLLKLINEKYTGRGFSVNDARGFGSHEGYADSTTKRRHIENSYESAVDIALSFKRSSGFTPIFTLDRTKPTSISIDLSHVYGLTTGETYYINVVGVAANSPKYYTTLLNEFYSFDGNTDLGAYPYHDDFYELTTSVKDNWVVDFTSETDYHKEEFYYSFAVSSAPFSYEDYPTYDPVTTSYVDDNGFTQTVELGRSFEDTMMLPPKFSTNSKIKQKVAASGNESGDVDQTTYKTIKEEESLNETVQTFKFDVPMISSLFDGSSSFFKFLTYCISLLPSSFMAILLSFFGIFLAIVLIKFVF
ncbi:MAG: hypothetical protein IJ740_01820 [Ruminococcus sp.]|nr:hypothetical protein [Ruminococcus sp.]